LQLTVLAKRAFPNFRTRLAIRRAALFPWDLLDLMTGRRDELIPPRGLWFVGGGHFNENQFLESFVELCDLRPNHRVLDVGCGIGKQAVPLTKYLNADGSYEGFDIVPEGIDWCERQIHRRFPNFRFRHVDIFNKHYNPHGKALPSQWHFPYLTGEFDFACAISVFTHMLPDAVRNYIIETARVVKPGAKSFLSFFLLNDQSRSLIARGQSDILLNNDLHGCAVLDPAFPETTVGLPEDFVKSCFKESGMTVSTVHYGSWCGRDKTHFYQDIVIATRR
jgi:SAM-dependent methyltransferase